MPHDPVFVPMRGEKISVNRDWVAIRAAADLPPDLLLHSLRHSLATCGVLAGLSMPELQRLMRHRSLSMTSRYIHLAEQQARLQDRAMAHLVPAPAGEVAPPARRKAVAKSGS
jgi:integrase